MARTKATPQELAAIRTVESNDNPDAVSPKGAMGRMQVMPGTAADPGFGIAPAKDHSDAELTRVGEEYYDKMLERYGGDRAKARAAYNAGPGRVDKSLKTGAALPAETRNYVAKLDRLAGGDSVILAQASTGTMTDVPADIGASYMAKRDQATVSADVEALLRRVEQARAGTATKPAAPDAPRPELSKLPEQPTEGIGIRVAKGIADVPVRGIVGGVRDAAQETLNAMDGLAVWLNQTTGWDPNSKEGDFIHLPEVPEPRTGAGKALREVTSFLTGFIPALKATKAANVAQKAGKAGKIAEPMVAGAIADFATSDAHEKRLSDLWTDVGLEPNLLTDYLKADPTDTVIEGKLKAAIEGAGLGTVAEGLVLATRAIRSARAGRTAAPQSQQQTAQQAAQHGVIDPQRDFLLLGNPKDPLLRVNAKEAADPGQKLVDAQALTDPVADPHHLVGAADIGLETGKHMEINFARIESPDDVKQVLGEMADLFSKEIDTARRGVQSNDVTEKLANDLGMTANDLLSRRKGQPLNAEEALAARRLMNASASKLLETAKLAADPNANPAQLYQFRRMMAVHQAVQMEVIAARTETARALQSWSIPAGGTEASRAVQAMLDGHGGNATTAAMAARLASVANNPGAINAMARKGWKAASMDAVKEAYVLGLLWSPSTHFTNIASNSLVAVQQIYERGAARMIGSALGREADEGVAPGEAAAMSYGMIMGLRDAFRLAGQALMTGKSTMSKIDHPPAITKEAFGISNTGLGMAVDLIGEATRIPGRLLASEDEFFKSIGYRMELHAQSVRQAVEEGYTGDTLATKVADLVQNPPEHIRIAAADAALYTTFQNKTGAIANSLMGLRDRIPGAFTVLPFIKTPANLLKYSFERTPFAPISAKFREDIAAGGARADLAMARMSTGSAIMAVAMDMAFSGLLSGAPPKGTGDVDLKEAKMRAGQPGFSVKIGEEWFNYNRVDPVGMMFGIASTIAETIGRAELNEDEFDEAEEIIAATIMATSASVLDKTFFKGVSQIVQAIQEPERGAEFWIEQTTGALVPFSTALGTAARAMDPVQPEINGMWEAVLARLPGMTERLQPKRDLWGKMIQPDQVYGAAVDVISPAKIVSEKDSPVDHEIVRLGQGPLRIRKKTSFLGANVDLEKFPEVYDEYVRLAGNEMKLIEGKGARDFLDGVVAGKSAQSVGYRSLSDGKDGMKVNFIKEIVNTYREAAQKQIFNDPRFGEFRNHVLDKRREQAELKLPVQ